MYLNFFLVKPWCFFFFSVQPFSAWVWPTYDSIGRVIDLWHIIVANRQLIFIRFEQIGRTAGDKDTFIFEGIIFTLQFHVYFTCNPHSDFRFIIV